MQTLGISNSTPATENRLKSLFWPSIQTGSDVDYLGTQGYWVCAIIAAFTLVAVLIKGQVIMGPLFFLFYYLGGVGVREHSRYAAAVVLIMYVVDTVLAPAALKVFLDAVLLSNMRATWIAAIWKPESTEAAMPIRLSETWGDKFADKLPTWLWPKVRVLYYIYSATLLVFTFVGVVIILKHRAH